MMQMLVMTSAISKLKPCKIAFGIRRASIMSSTISLISETACKGLIS